MSEQCGLTGHSASTRVRCMWLQYREAEPNTLGLSWDQLSHSLLPVSLTVLSNVCSAEPSTLPSALCLLITSYIYTFIKREDRGRGGRKGGRDQIMRYCGKYNIETNFTVLRSGCTFDFRKHLKSLGEKTTLCPLLFYDWSKN